MRVYNFLTLTPLDSYNIWFRMETTADINPTALNPTIDIQINHNNSVDNSIVSQYTDLPLTQNPILPLLSAPALFEIHNPQIMNEYTQIGYIGPLFVQFTSTLAGQFDIQLALADHQYNWGGWKTPNSDDLDPLVCLINNIRYDCDPVNGPLVISISAADVVPGLNHIKIDSEYIEPFNGIKFPDVAGMYFMTLTLTGSGSTFSSSFLA